MGILMMLMAIFLGKVDFGAAVFESFVTCSRVTFGVFAALCLAGFSPRWRGGRCEPARKSTPRLQVPCRQASLPDGSARHKGCGRVLRPVRCEAERACDPTRCRAFAGCQFTRPARRVAGTDTTVRTIACRPPLPPIFPPCKSSRFH